MKKIKLNAWINILMVIVFIPIAVSGVVLKYDLPKGSKRAGEAFWGLIRHDWLTMHDITSLIFTILIITHLLLHLKWIQCLPKLIKNQKKCDE